MKTCLPQLWSKLVCHIDGYVKLKPFGIAINGGIDGFSRKMIWLEAYKTNGDPKIIAGYLKQNEFYFKLFQVTLFCTQS